MASASAFLLLWLRFPTSWTANSFPRLFGLLRLFYYFRHFRTLYIKRWKLKLFDCFESKSEVFLMIITEIHCLPSEHWCVFDYFYFPFRRVAWRSRSKTKQPLQLPTTYSVFEFLHPFTLRINRINRKRYGGKCLFLLLWWLPQNHSCWNSGAIYIFNCCDPRKVRVFACSCLNSCRKQLGSWIEYVL